MCMSVYIYIHIFVFCNMTDDNDAALFYFTKSKDSNERQNEHFAITITRAENILLTGKTVVVPFFNEYASKIGKTENSSEFSVLKVENG